MKEIQKLIKERDSKIDNIKIESDRTIINFVTTLLPIKFGYLVEEKDNNFILYLTEENILPSVKKYKIELTEEQKKNLIESKSSKTIKERDLEIQKIRNEYDKLISELEFDNNDETPNITLSNNIQTILNSPKKHQERLEFEKLKNPMSFIEREAYLKQPFMVDGIYGDKNLSLQKYHTPFWLCDKMIRKLQEYTGIIRGKRILIYNIEFLDFFYRYGLMLDNEVYFVNENPLKVGFANEIYIGDQNDKFVVNEFLKISEDMKFNIIMMNPPYQAASGVKSSLWDKFVEKAISLLNPEYGFLCAVHPNGWRGSDGKFKNLQKEMLSKQIFYLELHSYKDGKKTFNVDTAYDWYVLKHTLNSKETTVIDMDGEECYINIGDFEFIPDVKIKDLFNLVAKEGEDKVQLISDSSYHTQRNYTSKEKNDVFKYPIVYSVNSKNEPTFHYSSINNKGHFGIPKVIFGNGAGSGVFVDEKGEYGMTEFSKGIVDTPENLENIKKALINPLFIKNVMGDTGGNKYDKKIIKILKKDFWKSFIS